MSARDLVDVVYRTSQVCCEKFGVLSLTGRRLLERQAKEEITL